MTIQLCFQVKDAEHNASVIAKLKELKEHMNGHESVISCHMPRHIVEEKGWSTEMIDTLEEIFGSQYRCMVTETSFDEAMKNLNATRMAAALTADKIFVIGEQSIANIALEIQLFTNNRVQFI